MKIIVFVSAVLCCAGSALAATSHFTLPANTSRTVAYGGAFNEDCSSMGDAAIRITTPPQHGAVVTKRGASHTSFPAGNPRSACNARTVMQELLIYTPQRDYVGDDSVSYEIIFPNGGTQDNTVSISVK